MSRALSLAGLEQHVKREGPNPSLAEPYCQWAAAARRESWEREALSRMKAEFGQGIILLAVTVIFPKGLSHDLAEVLPQGDVERINHVFRRAIARAPAVLCFTGAIEVDYCLKDGARFWQRSAHVCAVVRADSVAAAKRIIRSAIGLDRTSWVARPVVSREMHNPLGWVRYCFKGQSFGATVRKSSYPADDRVGRKRGSCKQRLQAPERRALLRAMADIRPSSWRIQLPD